MKGALAVPLLLVFVGFIQGSSALDPEQVPCSDPRGCPDLITDSASLVIGTQRTEAFGPNHCAVQEGAVEAGARQIIRVSFTFGNAGKGDLILGAPSAHPDWFEWSGCHGHYHVKEHATFRVWTVDGFLAWDALRTADPSKTADEVFAEHPELLSQMVTGKKQGFCIVSQEPLPPNLNGAALTPDISPQYNQFLNGDVCGRNQGQDPGWADTYILTQDGMWVDVTDLPTGQYILEGEMNSNHFITETDYSNNRVFTPMAVVSAL